jgi:hypothetical protein
MQKTATLTEKEAGLFLGRNWGNLVDRAPTSFRT